MLNRITSALVATFVLVTIINFPANANESHGPWLVSPKAAVGCIDSYRVHVVNPNEHMDINANTGPHDAKVLICKNGDIVFQTTGAFNNPWFKVTTNATLRFTKLIEISRSKCGDLSTRDSKCYDNGMSLAFQVLYLDPYGYKTVAVSDRSGRQLFRLDGSTIIHLAPPELEKKFDL